MIPRERSKSRASVFVKELMKKDVLHDLAQRSSIVNVSISDMTWPSAINVTLPEGFLL